VSQGAIYANRREEKDGKKDKERRAYPKEFKAGSFV
jgi:hypothetical protein